MAKKLLTSEERKRKLAKTLTTTNDYWQTRLQQFIFDKANKELNKRLKTVYSRANKTIADELVILYNKMLEGGEISPNMLYRENRYRVLQQKITKIVQDIGKTEEKLITKSLFTSYKQVYQQTMKGLGVNSSWTIMNENMAKQFINTQFKGSNFSDRIWSNKSKLKDMIEKSVIDNVVAGQSNARAVKDIKKTFGVSYNDADRIVRTETQRVLNEGQRQSYKDRGTTEVRWIVAHDERLCDDCLEMLTSGIDGTDKYYIDEVPSIVHPRCRCTFVEMADRELFKQADMDKVNEILNR